MPVGAVDTNVRRVLGRLVAGSRDAVQGREPQSLADAAVPAAEPAAWTHALMDIGATICRTTGPLCAACPAGDRCRYVATSGSEEHAAEAPPRGAVPRDVALAARPDTRSATRRRRRELDDGGRHHRGSSPHRRRGGARDARGRWAARARPDRPLAGAPPRSLNGARAGKGLGSPVTTSSRASSSDSVAESALPADDPDCSSSTCAACERAGRRRPPGRR